MPDVTPIAPATARKGRRTVLLIAAVAAAPVIASYVAYYFFPRAERVNHGVLLPTHPAPPIEGTQEDGSAFRLDALRGRWVLLAAGGGACDAECDRTLYAMRQSRTMQGKEQERIVRVWLALGDAPPGPAFLSLHPGLIVARVAEPAAAALPGGIGPLYIIDPLGNLVLRYPSPVDIRGVASDLARLLKASRIG